VRKVAPGDRAGTRSTGAGIKIAGDRLDPADSTSDVTEQSERGAGSALWSLAHHLPWIIEITRRLSREAAPAERRRGRPRKYPRLATPGKSPDAHSSEGV